MSHLADLAAEIGSFPFDRKFLPQDELNLTARERTSVYPWRGQFSPELVERLLNVYAIPETVVLDPFVGSGTTLFEATRRGLQCYGSEINPAAVALAGMARFSCLEGPARLEICKRAERMIGDTIGTFLPARMYGAAKENSPKRGASLYAAAKSLLSASRNDIYAYDLILTSVMLAMKDGPDLDARKFLEAFERNKSLVAGLTFSMKPCQVCMTDARALVLADRKVHLVVTSPPYINVFNYHQNYRKAVELAGWRLLEIAVSESGSNRKHRSNRFKTVVQYCMDLAMVFAELGRVLTPTGRAVFVVGRESRVRGVSFNNARLLAMVATGREDFTLERWQERKFINRFGETIFEDLLTFQVGRSTSMKSCDWGREIGLWALDRALQGRGETAQDIRDAIREAEDIRPSPIYRPTAQDEVFRYAVGRSCG